jgi:hypothetical protein
LEIENAIIETPMLRFLYGKYVFTFRYQGMKKNDFVQNFGIGGLEFQAVKYVFN